MLMAVLEDGASCSFCEGWAFIRRLAHIDYTTGVQAASLGQSEWSYHATSYYYVNSVGSCMRHSKELSEDC